MRRIGQPARCGLSVTVALALGLLLTACAGVRVSSFVDPAGHSRPYDGFLAYAAFSDLGIEAAYEQALCKRLHDAGHACTTLLKVAPPTREHTGASRHAAARDSGAQAVIIIELVDDDSSARQRLTEGGPGYRISLIDNASQTVVMRLAAQAPAGRRALRTRAAALAEAIVATLKDRALLLQR